MLTPAPGQQERGISQIDASSTGPSLPLIGPRLYIRPLERQDLDRRQAWPPFNDPLYVIWDMPRYSQRENDHWYVRLTDGRHHLAYGVEDRAGGLIGMLSLREISWGGSARLGVAFCSTHVGQGYGTESLHLFLPYFFLTLGFRRMVLDVIAANFRAVRCYRRVGFHRVRSYWRAVDGPLDPQFLEQPEYSHLRPFYRWRWRRAETLYYDMELSHGAWVSAKMSLSVSSQ